MAAKSKIAKRLIERMYSLDAIYAKYAESRGLTFMSLSILEILYEKGKCTQKEICEESHYQKQSVNVIIRSFLNEGYVKLKEKDEDRRHKEITFTEKGRNFAAGIVDPLWKIQFQALELITDEQCGILLDAIEKYVGFMDKKIGEMNDVCEKD